MMAISPVPMENEVSMYGISGPSVLSFTPAQKNEKPAPKIFNRSLGGGGGSGGDDDDDDANADADIVEGVM